MIDSRVEAHAHYAAALIHAMDGEGGAALDEFFQAAHKDPADESLTLDVSRRLIQANQTDRALQLLTNATARAVASGRVYAELGFLNALLGRREAAFEADRTAIKRSPTLLNGYRYLFALYIQSKEYEEAHKVLDQALKQSQADAEYLIDLGELYLAFGRVSNVRIEEARADALTALHRAENLKPTDPDVRLKLAEGLYALGERDQAAPIYRGLLREYPDSTEIRTSVRAKLIDIYLRGKDRAHAAEQLEAVVRDDPSDAQAYFLLGSLAYEEKKLQPAAGYFAKAILFSPDFEPAYYDLATVQIGLGQGKEAVATLRQARSRFGDTFAVEYLTGVACRADQQYDDAIRAFTAAEVIAKATDRKRLNEYLYFQFASAYERKGDVEQAVRYLEKTLEIAPDFTEALNYLGYMWAERGENLERARSMIEKAVKLEPNNAAYLDSLGWVLFRLGKSAEALPYLEKAIGLSVEPDPTLYDHLGDVQAALQHLDQAKEAWRKSVALEPSERISRKLESPNPKSPNPN